MKASNVPSSVGVGCCARFSSATSMPATSSGASFAPANRSPHRARPAVHVVIATISLIETAQQFNGEFIDNPRYFLTAFSSAWTSTCPWWLHSRAASTVIGDAACPADTVFHDSTLGVDYTGRRSHKARPQVPHFGFQMLPSGAVQSICVEKDGHGLVERDAVFSPRWPRPSTGDAIVSRRQIRAQWCAAHD